MPSKESTKKECINNEEVVSGARKYSHQKPKQITYSYRDEGSVLLCEICLETSRNLFMAVESNVQESALGTRLAVCEYSISSVPFI
jgi:hypothetical protein